MLNFLALFLAFHAGAYAQLPERPVNLGSALVTGTADGALMKYLGIPFAKAPRFDLPQAITSYTGNITASAYGPACPQQYIPALPSPYTGPESEDCLSINIIKPAATNSTVNLPVVVWIYGGGFEFGAASEYDEMGKEIVSLSVQLGKPVIYVSMNYRVSAYGFLASQEVANEGLGNFGLYDQRVALHWVQSYIHAFGGDASKVTVWGQSAGAMSASFHMLAFGGKSENLFRGVFMQSGAPVPVGPIQSGQKYYDALVAETNCTETEDDDTLKCLRGVPLADLRIAVDKSPNVLDYQSLVLAWLPRVDGIFLQDEPHKLISQDKIVDVPTVSGNCDDEGTIFSLNGPKNISTDADFKDYIRTIWAPGATEDELSPLWTYYTSVPSQGSPFGKPNLVSPYPQYNRIAAFQGDSVFQGPRRFFTEALSHKTEKTWAYLSKRFKLDPLGSFHGSDIYPKSNFTQPYVVNFANNLDPNIGSGTPWPTYDTTGSELPEIFTFFASLLGVPDVRVDKDDYRTNAIKYLTQLSFDNPI